MAKRKVSTKGKSKSIQKKAINTDENKSPKKSKKSRVRAIKKEVDGRVFDSTMEADYYEEVLKPQMQKGLIKVEFQPKYLLLQSYKKSDGKTVRELTYISDFKVTNLKDETSVVIDVKGREFPEFKIKRKLFDFLYPEENLLLVIYDKVDKKWYDFDEFKKIKAARVKENKKKKEAKQKGADK
jgi:hypothetical protein